MQASPGSQTLPRSSGRHPLRLHGPGTIVPDAAVRKRPRCYVPPARARTGILRGEFSPAVTDQVVPMKVGVAKETAPGERRVALVPEVLDKLKAAALDVLVETGAGAGAAIPDSAYAEAGATISGGSSRTGRTGSPRRPAAAACGCS